MKLYQDITFGAASMSAELIEAFLKYRKTKKEEELNTPEWKQLEKSYSKHLIWRLNYPSKAFGQQLFSTWVFTILIISLIISGLSFSFIQLNNSIKHGDLSNLNTELAIETAGKLSINSSVVGAVVLIISLVFFYLYLKHVFQIKHPVPPHVSLSDTDAFKMRRSESGGEEVPKEFIQEIEGILDKYNNYEVSRNIKYYLHGAVITDKKGKSL